MSRNRALDDLVDALAATQHGAFTLGQLTGVGDRQVAADRVRAGEWTRFARGTYVLPRRTDEWTDCAAMCLHVPAAAVADAAAGRWWGFDGVGEGAGRLLVPASCAVRHPMLRRSRDLLAWEVRFEPGGCLRITDPTRTLIDLGGSLDRTDLELAVETALRSGLTSEPRLRLRARQLRVQGRRGPSPLLDVLEARAQGRADSSGEVRLLQLLRRAGIERPTRQHRLGRWRFDLAWPHLRVAVELDGAHHRTKGQLQRDDRKQNAAVLQGWTVLRFTWDRIEGEPNRVVAEVVQALTAAGARPI